MTVLASPRVLEGSERKITLVSPDYTRTEQDKIGTEIQQMLKSKYRDDKGLLLGDSSGVLVGESYFDIPTEYTNTNFVERVSSSLHPDPRRS